MMVDGGAAPPRTLIPPRRIVTRHSTDVVATEDIHVARAIRFIREHACEGIHANDVLQHVPLSGPWPRSRFKKTVGKTIHVAIHQAQADRVKTLLAETNMPLKRITHLAGFRYVEYMTLLFRQCTGETPAAFRKRAQIR